MITQFQIYLITIADKLDSIFGFIAIISLISCIMVYMINTESEQLSKWRKSVLILSTLAFISGIIYALIPSTKSLIAIYTIPPIVNNKEVQKLPENLIKFANDYLEKLNKKEERNETATK